MLETAHVSSTLGKIFSELSDEIKAEMSAEEKEELGENKLIPDVLHYPIARKIIHGYSDSIDAVLPGHKKMKDTLISLCDEQLSNHYD